MNKKKYIRARPDGENQWVYDTFENKTNYIDEPENELYWEIEEIFMTEEEFKELPEFGGW